MKRRVVLTVLPDVPTPPVTGLHLRMLGNLSVVRALGCESHILYFTTEDSVGDPDGLRGLHDGETCAGPRWPYAAFSVPARVVQRAAFTMRALSRTPGSSYPYSVSYDAAGGGQQVLRASIACAADVVILPSFLVHYASMLLASGRRVIADAADVLTDVSWGFLKRYGRRHPLRAPGLLANFLGCRAQERLFLRSCSEVWATSAAEAKRLRDLCPGSNVLVVANSLDDAGVQATPPPASEDVGFIGTYSYAPNLDAATFLVGAVFPKVVARVPGARLKLAGAGMPAGPAQRFSRTEYVDLLGSVPDALGFARSCAVLALPVTLRGGIPLKLIEGMAAGRPIVASPEIVAGLPLRHGHDVLIARDSSEMADGIVTLLRDPALSASIGASSRRVFDEHFSLSAAIRSARSASILAAP